MSSPRSSCLKERLEMGLVWLRRRSRSDAAFLLAADGLTVMAGQPRLAGWDRFTPRLAKDLVSSGSVGADLFQVEDDGRVFSIIPLGPGGLHGFLLFVRSRPLPPPMGRVFKEEVTSWFRPPA